MSRVIARLIFPVFFAVLGMTETLPAWADETAIRKMVESYVEAFNGEDLDALAAMWSENGNHIDRETGERTEGRQAIRADLQRVFQERPKMRLVGRIDRVRLITPDVASIAGETTLAVAGEEPSVSVFSAILVNANGNWLIDSIEEAPRPQPVSASDALRELEWLVGRWVDKSEEAQVDTTVSWTTSNAFLLRSFVIRTSEGLTQQGTQVIGWDPRSQQIRSWTFSSDGSFGDAEWSKNGDDWLIKSSQTLPDGQAASGTFVLTRVDDNTLTLALIGHEIEGTPQPAREPVTVVRVAEEADSASATGNEK